MNLFFIFVFLLDETERMITSAKNMAKNANDITDNVLNELNPIKEDVDKIKLSYESTRGADFNKALTDVSNTGTDMFVPWIPSTILKLVIAFVSSGVKEEKGQC